jgi:hypothetical protein
MLVLFKPPLTYLMKVRGGRFFVPAFEMLLLLVFDSCRFMVIASI